MKDVLLTKRMVLGVFLLGVLLHAVLSARGQIPDQPTFGVVVRSDFAQPLEINRVFYASERHIVAQLAPGERIDADIAYDSDQVFIIWHNREILDVVKFDPRKNLSVGITIDRQGRVTTQLGAPRR